MNFKNWGDIIRWARKAKGKSQPEVAKQIGVTFNAVNNWELGHRVPKLPNVIKIAEVLGYEPLYLVRIYYEEVYIKGRGNQ